MIADIFYPIFTLTIIVLACFIRKKKIVRGFRTHAFTKALRWTPWVAYNSSQTPSCNRFWLYQKPMRSSTVWVIANQCTRTRYGILTINFRFNKNVSEISYEICRYFKMFQQKCLNRDFSVAFYPVKDRILRLFS